MGDETSLNPVPGLRLHCRPPTLGEDGSPAQKDGRSPAQKDRDKILYSSALRRLAEVTQVVGADEGHVFHNRLTHTLKVAQLSRRIAEQLVREQSDLLKARGGLDPEIVEAAALAHDLGHPPFGHIAESELDRLIRGAGNSDGFEGNAQSFRIVTRLAAHTEDYDGLNLTHRTLNAVLKYPWFRGEGRRPDKFGAYRSDTAAFEFARSHTTEAGPSLEAAIMDFADSVTYSVHDLLDFYQAGLVPIGEVSDDLPEHLERFKKAGKVDPNLIDKHKDSLDNLVRLLPGRGYKSTHADRVLVGSTASWLISEFVAAVTLKTEGTDLTLTYSDEVEVRMRFLQNLVWHYVIVGQAVASQQVGQVRIIRDLFRTYLLSIRGSLPHDLEVTPSAYDRLLLQLGALKPEERRNQEVRLAGDIVASLTEHQARRLHRRFRGMDLGSVTDHVAR